LRLALLVGNNHHVGTASRDLSYADDDALEAARLLLWTQPDTHIWLLTESEASTDLSGLDPEVQAWLPPTRAGWQEAIAALGEEAKAFRARSDDEVHLLVHFAGHGERGGSMHLQDGYLTKEEFLKDLTSIGADAVFSLLDGCYLADVARGDGDEAGPPVQIYDSTPLKNPNQPKSLCLVASTTPVSENDDLGGGLLTAIGMGALLGPADLDSDRRITCEEWGEYVARHFDLLQGAPSVTVSMRQAARRSVVVDLSTAEAGGVRLEAGFPQAKSGF
jgi:hypothetical protein